MSFFSRLQAAMFPGSVVEASEPAPPLPTLQVGSLEANVFERYAATLALTEWKA